VVFFLIGTPGWAVFLEERMFEIIGAGFYRHCFEFLSVVHHCCLDDKNTSSR